MGWEIEVGPISRPLGVSRSLGRLGGRLGAAAPMTYRLFFRALRVALRLAFFALATFLDAG